MQIDKIITIVAAEQHTQEGKALVNVILRDFLYEGSTLSTFIYEYPERLRNKPVLRLFRGMKR